MLAAQLPADEFEVHLAQSPRYRGLFGDLPVVGETLSIGAHEAVDHYEDDWPKHVRATLADLGGRLGHAV